MRRSLVPARRRLLREARAGVQVSFGRLVGPPEVDLGRQPRAPGVRDERQQPTRRPRSAQQCIRACVILRRRSTRHTPILRSASLRSSCCCWKGKVAKSWRSFSVRIMAGQRAWSSGGGQVQRRGVAGHIRSRERTAGGLALPSAPPSESGGKPVSARLAAQLVRAEKAGQIVQLKFTATSFVREARRLPSPC